jgi:hypothetical protein
VTRRESEEELIRAIEAGELDDEEFAALTDEVQAAVVTAIRERMNDE